MTGRRVSNAVFAAAVVAVVAVDVVADLTYYVWICLYCHLSILQLWQQLHHQQSEHGVSHAR